MFYLDPLLIQDQKKFDFNLGGSLAYFGIKKIAQRIIPGTPDEGYINQVNASYFQYGKKRIALISNVPAFNQCSEKLQVDYLIISGNQRIKPDMLFKYYNPSMVIMDGSNSISKTGKIAEVLKNKGIPHWITKEKGAFIGDLSWEP